MTLTVWLLIRSVDYEGDWVESVHATEAGALDAAREYQSRDGSVGWCEPVRSEDGTTDIGGPGWDLRVEPWEVQP